ncbi:DUF2000 family protein [Ascidiaceihabitans sp.]|nr:DUF2000 family protein [Ascidiaceihabitans sp.]
MFEAKIVIVVREDLATWLKLNVTAFLMGGIAFGVEKRSPTKSPKAQESTHRNS